MQKLEDRRSKNSILKLTTPRHFKSNTKRISIKMDAQLIEQNHIDFFKKLVKKHKGDQEIVFNLSANGNGLNINLYSVKNKVKISEELIKSLKEKKLEFRLN